MQPVGLRELKKSRTRELIAGSAAELFRERGYDAVTVEDVAQQAQVSKKTVFNYFPTKEDLVFDRADDREAGLLAAVDDRAVGVTVIESFRTLCHRQVEGLPRLRRSATEGGFFELVAANPVLQRKMHEVNARLVRTLAVALASEAGTEPTDPVAEVVAWTLIGAQRTLYLRLRQRAAGDTSDATVVRQHRRDVNRVFDLLDTGLGHYPDR